ncbi:hypothetical protein UFOVP1365_58 [uncultured Caudovirales phage]|uniref:Uncharacterized protein n=1 Tax=uncultured Caudovirales phage TaxID=2100421 RepID=A0A6J5RWW6_9CAUD|nr:hypothetical protein UFOVP1365_58 [uncultured Caudovirales phage]
MKYEPLKSINDLFYRAGGSVKIAALLELNQYTVDRWLADGTGVPKKHYAVLCANYRTTPDELDSITAKARRMHGRKDLYER